MAIRALSLPAGSVRSSITLVIDFRTSVAPIASAFASRLDNSFMIKAVALDLGASSHSNDGDDDVIMKIISGTNRPNLSKSCFDVK